MICENDIMEFTRKAFCLKHKIDEKIGKQFSLAAIEVEILTFIYVYGEKSTATHIEHARNIKKNTISVHVENLVKLGFLLRKEKEDDRRANNLSLTEKAKDIAKSCLQETKQMEAKLQNGLTKEELHLMHHCFQIINKNAAELMEMGV